LPQPNENGTPQPRDEPLAENAPSGAIIDYYLKARASGPVVLEILDQSGATVRRYSSEDRAPQVNPDSLNVPAFWIHTPEPLSRTAGMHRWLWDLRPTPPPDRGSRGAGGDDEFGGRNSAVIAGTYTVKLTVDGKSYTQPLRVKMDPRAN
jgi:hypothetical protein